MAPAEDADHEHTLVPRLRERDLVGWEQCTGCTYRTEEYPVQTHALEGVSYRAEWTDEELIELRIRNARELEAAAQEGN